MMNSLLLSAMLATAHMPPPCAEPRRVVVVGGPLPERPPCDCAVKLGDVLVLRAHSASTGWDVPGDALGPVRPHEHFWRRFDRRRKHKRKH